MSDRKNEEVKAENMENSGKNQDVAIITQPQETAGGKKPKKEKSQRRRKSLWIRRQRRSAGRLLHSVFSARQLCFLSLQRCLEAARRRPWWPLQEP